MKISYIKRVKKIQSLCYHAYYHLTQTLIFIISRAEHDSMTVVFAINNK